MTPPPTRAAADQPDSTSWQHRKIVRCGCRFFLLQMSTSAYGYPKAPAQPSGAKPPPPGSKDNLRMTPLRPKGKLRRPNAHSRAPRSDRDARVAKISFRTMPPLNTGRPGGDGDHDSSLNTHAAGRL